MEPGFRKGDPFNLPNVDVQMVYGILYPVIQVLLVLKLHGKNLHLILKTILLNCTLRDVVSFKDCDWLCLGKTERQNLFRTRKDLSRTQS